MCVLTYIVFINYNIIKDLNTYNFIMFLNIKAGVLTLITPLKLHKPYLSIFILKSSYINMFYY